MKNIKYQKGGYCPVSEQIELPDPDYPKFPSNSIWLGVLEGTWYEIGEQYGQGVSELINYTFDTWFKVALESYGEDKTKKFAHKYEEEIIKFNPDFIKWMKGVSVGAAEGLAKSKYADRLSDYEKILFMNIWSPFYYRLPESTKEEDNCTGIAILPEATADGKLMAARNTQFGSMVGCYSIAYVAKPPAPARSFWTVTYPGVLIGLHVANDQGLWIGHNTGSGPDRAFAAPWYFILTHAIAYSDTREEAVEILTLGPEEYRGRTGRKTLLREGGVLWLVADEESACVVEASAHSYALRYPGDQGEKGFIVTANHPLCNYSYNEDNQRTNVSMPEIMERRVSMTAIPDPNTPFGTETRYWSLYWSSMYNSGRIDAEMLKGPLFLSSHFWYDKNGKKIEYLYNPGSEGGAWMSVHYLYPHSTVCGHSGGWPEKYNHELPISVMYTPADRKVEWTQYKPCMWKGEWDQVQFIGE